MCGRCTVKTPAAEMEERFGVPVPKPLPPGLMVGYPVGMMVNKPEFDGPWCVEGI